MMRSSWSCGRAVLLATALVVSPSLNNEAHAFLSDQGVRRLGSVTADIGTGKWLEFDSNQTVGSEAYPCSSGCSNASSSQALGTNTAPWTFTSSACTRLTVIEGYTTGQTVYTVFDNGVSLGNTSPGTAGTTCTDDPTVCYADSKTGKRQWDLANGTHSIKIVVASQTTPLDGGWFQINTTSCPTTTSAPTRSPTRKPTANPNKTPTRAPTRKPSPPTRAPTKKPSSGVCISALQCAKKIRIKKLCSCVKFENGNTQCAKSQAVNVCCPNAYTTSYINLVLQKFKKQCQSIAIPFQ